VPLRCHDISNLPGLNSIRLQGGINAADNQVRWPYVAENRSFKNWIKGGELVFVTGISRHRDPANLAECLYEGKACNISGLVVLTGDAYINRLPASLYKLADKLELPLFEQPYSLPMVTVTETISRAIVKSEQVGDILSKPKIRPADAILLEAWITHRGNQKAMADDLGCHRNTIRNRLNHLTRDLSNHTSPTEYFSQQLLIHLLTKP
jgi:hypothetical protein